MPVTYVYTENTVAQWRTYTNIIGANVGDLDRIDLNFPGNVDLVSAINALYSFYLSVNTLANATSFDVGNVSGFFTTSNNNVVLAVNEVWSNVGPMPNLLTNAKSNIVYAVNEVWSNVGPLPNLLTSANANIVYAINEVVTNILIQAGDIANLWANAGIQDGNVGPLPNLLTTANANVVYAINELWSNTGPISNLLTNANANLVYAINEVWGNVGPLPNLLTNANANVVYAINEVWGNVGPLPNLATIANANIVYAINELVANIGPFGNLVPALQGDNVIYIINDLYANPNPTFNVNVTVHANLHVDDTIRANGNVDVYDTLNTRGNVDLAGNIATIRTNVFYITSPEADFNQNVLVRGNLLVLGEFRTQDSLLHLSANNNINPTDNIDIGFVGAYPETFALWSEVDSNVFVPEGAPEANTKLYLEDDSGEIVLEDHVDGPNTIVRYAGLFRDASKFDDRFIFFANLINQPTGNTVNTANLSFNLTNVQADYFLGNLQGWADWARHIYATNVIENGNTTSGNVFFSNSRARFALGNTGAGINYNRIAGLFSIDVPTLATAVLGSANTDLIPEGNTNLYYTNARAQNFISGWLTAADPLFFDAANGILSIDAFTTDNVPEGITNLYFTQERARNSISNVGSIILYNPLTGEISANVDQIVSGVTSWNGATGVVNVNSDALPEGVVNLYFSDTNWNLRLLTLYTNMVKENPDSNLANTTVGNVYFSNARARAAFANIGPEIQYDKANGTISFNSAAIIAGVSSVNAANGNVILYTSNIAENPDANISNTTVGNVYFTNTRARNAIFATGAVVYDNTSGNIYVPGPYGLAYRRYRYTLAAPGTVISGPDDDGHTMYHELAAATDVFVNGIKAIATVDYTINNTFPSSNVVFTVTLPAGTEVLTQEITGNLAVQQGYITETKTDYLENLVTVSVPSATSNCDLGLGANTVFRLNVASSTTVNFINPPLTAGKAFVFTVFTDLGPTNNGSWTITWPNKVRWDDNSAPIVSINPDVLEAYTFFTIDSGNLYYGYKNLQNASRY